LNKYEGMFLLDHGKVKSEPEKGLAEITAILEKHEGKIAQMGKWDERKLTYEINRQKRGSYILVHFEAPGSAIDEIRRDCALSEIISRQLLLAIQGEIFPPFQTAQEMDAAHGSRDFRERGSRPAPRREKRAEPSEAAPIAGDDGE
jgi:small subunit ribosomal protein S6